MQCSMTFSSSQSPINCYLYLITNTPHRFYEGTEKVDNTAYI